MTIAETHDRHDITFRKIGSSMERYERGAPVLPRELGTAVKVHPVGRVVRGKRDERIFRVRTATDGVTIAAIFRREHLLVLNSIVVAVRPPVVPAFVEVEKLLGRQHGVILGCEEVWEQETQAASSMLYSV